MEQVMEIVLAVPRPLSRLLIPIDPATKCKRSQDLDRYCLRSKSTLIRHLPVTEPTCY